MTVFSDESLSTSGASSSGNVWLISIIQKVPTTISKIYHAPL